MVAALELEVRAPCRVAYPLSVRAAAAPGRLGRCNESSGYFISGFACTGPALGDAEHEDYASLTKNKILILRHGLVK